MSSHEQNRKKICFYCTKKVTKNAMTISKSLIDKIQKNILPEYDITDSRFPTVLCSTCRYWVDLMEKGEKKKSLPFFDFKEIVLAPTTRTNKNTPCNCLICSTARQVGNKKSYIVSPESIQTEDKSTMFICKKCFSIVSKGLTHECNHNNLAKNVIILLEDVEQNRKEQIVSSLLDTFKKDNTEKNNVIKLQTKGKRKSIVLNPEAPEKK